MNKPRHPNAKPKLTNAERHARFVETARAIEVDESPEAFDRVFDKVVKPTRTDQKPNGA